MMKGTPIHSSPSAKIPTSRIAKDQGLLIYCEIRVCEFESEINNRFCDGVFITHRRILISISMKLGIEGFYL